MKGSRRKRLGVLSKLLPLDLINWQVGSCPHLPIGSNRQKKSLKSKPLQHCVLHTSSCLQLGTANIFHLSIAKNYFPKSSNYFPKTSQESSEHVGPSLHKMTAFCKGSRQRFHPSFARNFGRHILGTYLCLPNPCPSPRFQWDSDSP